MVKRKRKNDFQKVLFIWLSLSFSIAFGVWFAFGSLEWAKTNWDPLYLAGVGAIGLLVLLYLGIFKTETSVAMKKK